MVQIRVTALTMDSADMSFLRYHGSAGRIKGIWGNIEICVAVHRTIET